MATEVTGPISSQYADPLLATYAVGLKLPQTDWFNRAFPTQEVPFREGQYLKYTIGMKASEDVVGDNQNEWQQVRYSTDKIPYFIRTHGLEEGVSYTTASGVPLDGALQAVREQNAVALVRRQLEFNKVWRGSTILSTAANYDSSQTDDPKNWATAGTDVLGYVLNLRESFLTATGMYCNAAVMSPTLIHALRSNTGLINWAKYTAPRVPSETDMFADLVRSWLGLDYLEVANTVGDIGGTSAANVWNKKNALFYTKSAGGSLQMAGNGSVATIEEADASFCRQLAWSGMAIPAGGTSVNGVQLGIGVNRIPFPEMGVGGGVKIRVYLANELVINTPTAGYLVEALS